MERWENLSEEKKQELRDQIAFQVFLDEISDLTYQAFVEGTDEFNLKQQLLDNYAYALSLD